MTSLVSILILLLDVAWWILLIHVIMSWLINFNVLNLRQPIVFQIWSGLNRLLEPVYSRIRQFLPQTTGIDFAPLVAFLIIIILRILIVNNFA